MPYTKVNDRYTRTTKGWNETITTSDGTYEGPSGTIGQTYTLSSVKQGERKVGYRKIIKDGSDASTFYHRDDYIVEEMNPGVCTLTKVCYPDIPPLYTKSTSGWVGYLYPQSAVPESHLSTDYSAIDGAALTLLYKKIRSETSHMNGLQFFGELKEALRMIKRPASSILNGIKRYDTLLSKRKKGIPSRLSDDRKRHIYQDMVAGTWLEVSFGWKPLLSDTKDIVETIARFTLPDSQRTRVRSYKEGLLGSDITGFRDTISGLDVGADVDFRTETRVGVQYICGLRSNGSGPVNQLDRLRNLSGLTLENFVPTAWELMPYSFLIDYFTNVGDIITSAFTQTAGTTWKVKTVRLRTTRTIIQEPMFTAPNPPWTVTNFSGSKSTTKIVKSSVDRTPITWPLGVPDLTFSLPESVNKFANMTALLNGFRSKHQPPPFYYRRIR